jgi:hypothetical protein
MKAKLTVMIAAHLLAASILWAQTHDQPGSGPAESDSAGAPTLPAIGPFVAGMDPMCKVVWIVKTENLPV